MADYKEIMYQIRAHGLQSEVEEELRKQKFGERTSLESSFNYSPACRTLGEIMYWIRYNDLEKKVEETLRGERYIQKGLDDFCEMSTGKQIATVAAGIGILAVLIPWACTR